MYGKAILGIDAAWTATQPSGVALAAGSGSGWCLLTVQPSYQRFLAVARGDAPEARPSGGLPDVPAFLAACERLYPGGVDLVAVDMPLSLETITARRTSDNRVSQAYGARHCGTHTPSVTRPGRISDDLRAACASAGYRLVTAGQPEHALIEVYPHPALVELAGAERRLPYKLSKIRTYWPTLTSIGRKTRLLEEWGRIVALLDKEIAGVAAALPPPSVGASACELKAYEDQVDAVVCVWVGACALHGTADPFGDEASAIWIPRSRHGAATEWVYLA